MREKILFVDDEQNVLDAIQRQLRKNYCIETAPGPQQGLELVTRKGPYAVIVSDLRMPVMDGIQFLSRVREIAPDSIRMVLTGDADLQNAIQAVNEGNIFRFLIKPCQTEALVKVLDLGIEQYRLVTAERELLEKTLKGSIEVMAELLSMVNPEAFGRSSRIRRYVREIAKYMRLSQIWQLETAAMLSQIGCVTLPREALQKLYQGQNLTEKETQLFEMHPAIASDLLKHIPRMQEIAEIVACQQKHFDGTGHPKDNRQGTAIPLGARILKVVLDFDLLETKGDVKANALLKLQKREGWYDPDVLNALQASFGLGAKYEVSNVWFKDLEANMILDEDLMSEKGQLLLARGHEVGSIMLKGLKNYVKISKIKEPIKVFVPIQLHPDNQ